VALRDTARLVASLELEDKFSRPADRIDASAGKLEGRFSKLGTGAGKIGGGMAHAAGTIAKVGAVAGAVAVGGGIALLTKAFTAGNDALQELSQIQAQSAQVIRTTGGAAGQTAADIRKLAEETENLTTFDDKAVQGAENMLLTFTGIGPKAFRPALQAVTDLNAAMGGGDQGLQGVAIQVGKALNDPIKGVNALSRVGVSFTAQQIKQIKTLQDHNKTLDAQKIILAELNKEFGGQGKVFGSGPAAEARRLADAEEDLSRSFAEKLAPAVSNVRRALTGALANPGVIAGIGRIGDAIAGVFTADRVTGGITKLTDAFTTLFSQQNLSRASGVFEGAFSALKTVDFGAIAGGLKITADATKGVVDAFLSLPPDLQKIAVAALAANKLTGGLVTSGIADVVKGIAGLALGGLKTITAGSVTVVGASVAGSGVPGVPSPGGGSTLGKLASVVQNVAIVGITAEVAALLSPAVNQAGVDIHDTVFGKGTGLLGTGFQINPSEMEWPFGTKRPAWLPTNLASSPLGEALGIKPGGQHGGVTSGSFADEPALASSFKGIADADRRSEGALSRMAQALPEKVAARIGELSREFISALRTARERHDPQAAHRAATAAEGGAGNARNTARLLSTLESLRRDASRRGDRQTVKLLDGDIRRISAIADHRRLVAQQLARADRIVRSNASTKDKVEDLKGIERNIGSRNRTALQHVKDEISRLQGTQNKTANAIDRSRVHLANKIEDAGATTAEASRGTTRTIQQKSFTANVTVPVTTVIDGRTFRSTLSRTSQVSRYGGGGQAL
jgi:hypothetical protein